MFEFHGWAVIRYHAHDTDGLLQDRCWDIVAGHVRSLKSDLVSLRRHNECDSVLVAGQHNHRQAYVVQLFEQIAVNAPGSYGLLYVRDDEDTERGADYSNCFRAWRLCRGSVTEVDDPFLSPAIPTVEDAFDPGRFD